MNQPRLQDMPRHQTQLFNEIKRLLKQGKIPAALLNPAIIREHNENSPQVARIDHPGQEVSLDALALRYASDGIAVRKHFRDIVFPLNETTVKQDNADLSGMSRRDRHAEIEFNNE
ncbi:MAG: hypothetical protein B7Y23_02815 [Sulfurovum sp. 16-42-52]|nr:MAG: hypothetical protein B7Y23_02815 [Sulfurovum sp. 16-42-52]OZA46176.1 MAG: hypothetical protein B7X80_03245 [Sulfurovum sp. 17-42-90]